MRDPRVVLNTFSEEVLIFFSGFLDVIRENESFPSERQPVDESSLGFEVFLCEQNRSGGTLLKLKPSIKKQKRFREPPAF